ncbi:MAG TPA: hypothetical protein DDZ51_30315 [Planctomycetaceae bacterium]|nr:hypothetical protein [Planctomycetaceae bacterium]
MSDRFERCGFSALCLLLLISIGGLAPDSCLAQLSASKKSQLISNANQAKNSLGHRPYPSPQQAGEGVTVAVSALNEYLFRRTSGQRAADWLDYVDADPLIDAIVSKKSATEVNNAARELQSRLVGNIVGLEMPPLVKLREATEAMIAAGRYPDPDRSHRWVQQQLDSLIKTLETGDVGNSPEDAARLSLVLQLLAQSNQVPELVSDIYHSFSRPNLVVTLDGRIIQDAIARPVDRFRPVRDCILGTRIVGNGHLRGELVGRLSPSIGRVQVDLVLTGQFLSDSVGYNGPVRLPSVGQGAITATRSLWIGEDGVSLSNVSSSASLDTTITSIQHPLRIVRRIASKQVAQKKPQADQIARERFRNQVVTDFTNQTSEAAQRLQSGPTGGSTPSAKLPPLSDAQTTLKRLNLSPPTRLIGSTSHSVFAQVTQRSGKQLAASTSPPSLGTFGNGIVSGDATLQVHESLIDNLASTVLGGRTMTGEQIDQLIGSVKNTSISRATPGSAIEPPPEKFEIEFASLRPIIFELRDQKIRVGIRGNRFSQDGRDLRSSLEITATYEPIDMGGYKILRRTGIVKVDFPGSGRIGVQQVAQRRSIQKLFKDRFPETLLNQPLILPVLAMVPSLSGRVYRVSGIDAQNGWLTLTVR